LELYTTTFGTQYVVFIFWRVLRTENAGNLAEFMIYGRSGSDVKTNGK
jgi:hypothetical protein